MLLGRAALALMTASVFSLSVTTGVVANSDDDRNWPAFVEDFSQKPGTLVTGCRNPWESPRTGACDVMQNLVEFNVQGFWKQGIGVGLPNSNREVIGNLALTSTRRGSLGIVSGDRVNGISGSMWASRPNDAGGTEERDTIVAGMKTSSYYRGLAIPDDGWIRYRLSGNGLLPGSHALIRLEIRDFMGAFRMPQIQWTHEGPIIFSSCSSAPALSAVSTNAVPVDPSLLTGLSLDIGLPLGQAPSQPDVGVRDARGCISAEVGRTSQFASDVALRLHRFNVLVPYVDVFAIPSWQAAGLRVKSMLMADLMVDGDLVFSNLPIGDRWFTVAELAPAGVLAAAGNVLSAANLQNPNYQPGNPNLSQGLIQEDIRFWDPLAKERGTYKRTQHRWRKPIAGVNRSQVLTYEGPDIRLLDSKTSWVPIRGPQIRTLWPASKKTGKARVWP